MQLVNIRQVTSNAEKSVKEMFCGAFMEVVIVARAARGQCVSGKN